MEASTRRAPFRRKMWHFVQPQITAARPVAQIQSRHDVEKSHQLGRLIPWITDQPFVCAFAGEDDFLSVRMDALGQFEQGAARGIDHRSFGGFNEPWITFERFAIAVFLDNWRLGSDVPRGETGRAQFVKLRLIHPHRVSVDRRTFETAGQGEDHARIHTAGKIGSDRNIRAQPFLDRLQEELLEFIDQRTRIVSPFLFTLRREIHFPVGAFRNDRTLCPNFLA